MNKERDSYKKIKMKSKFTNQNVDARAGPGTILSALVQACCHHRRRKTSVIDDEIDSEKD